jgi:POT family proton-dependent oligopeptide transporter
MTAVGNFVAGKIGEATGGEGGEMSKDLTLAIYSKIGWITIAIGVVVLLVSPVVRRWMHLETLADRVAPRNTVAIDGGRAEEPSTAVLPART